MNNATFKTFIIFYKITKQKKTLEVQGVERVSSQLDPWIYFNIVIEYGPYC